MAKTLYAERYEIIAEVGQGGMATVFRARDRRLDRHVALKVMHPFLAGNERNRRRFHREAQVVGKLEHDNIVQVYDYGVNISFGPDQSHGYVDTVPAIQAMARDYPASALFHDHVHPTALTNRCIAGLVAAKLDPWLRARLKEQR